ncbi:MAG: DNA primase, partial [Ottowia sp.]|nr:DNA primase [Ottowia sp.]
MPIPQHFIADLLARADIVDIVGRHVQLKKAGANYLGLCPFHGEKTPSFNVSPSRQFFHCFGCGKHGDAISFIMEHTGATFREAVEDLAQQCGLTVPEDERSPQERQRAAEQRQRQDSLADVLQRAARAWKQQLKSAPHAIDYLKKRGLSGEIAARYGLGYAAAGWHALASVFPDYASPLLEEGGLVIEKDGKRYDRFRDRITFPIRSLRGQVIGFGARTMGDEKPKYLNSPETALFHKGQELYGLYEARNVLHQRGWALVVEGYMDVLALAQFGLGNAVATLGTACTSEHLRKLLRFTSRVVFAFDGDAAGRKAARRALEAALPLASDTRSFRFLFLPPEHDPDSFIRAEGADAFERAANDAPPLSRFMLEAASEDCDLTSAEGRAHFAANARALWQALPDSGLLRQQLLTDIAARAGLDATALLHTWGAQRPRSAAPRSTPAPERRRPAFAPAPRHSKHTSALQAHARNLTRLLLHDAALWDEVSEDERSDLCSAPGDWGDALRWLEQQFQEHG